MSPTNTNISTEPSQRPRKPRNRLFSILLGLSALAVLLQGLWAGLFFQEGQDYKESWVQVHALGGKAAIGLAIIATIVALVKLRSRLDIVVGALPSQCPSSSRLISAG